MEKKEFRTYLSLGVLGMLGSSGTILADTFFVSHRLGTTGLAALNIAISIFGLLNGLGMLLGIGGATRFSILRAQRQTERANQAFTLAFGTATAAGLLLWAAGMLFARPLAQALGADGALLPLCTVYLRTVLCFVPCFLWNHLFMGFLRNDGSPRLAMWVMAAGSLANILLDYLFLYPLDMGIFGAALATGLSPVIGLAVAAAHRIAGKNTFHLVRTRPSAAALRAIAAPGLASFWNECASSVVLVVCNQLLARLAGTEGVATYGIVANLALIVLAVFTGMAQGIQPLLSRAYGRGDATAARALLRRGQRLAFGVGLGAAVLAHTAAPVLVSWFNSAGDPALQQLAQAGVALYFTGFLFVGHNYLTAAFLSTTDRAGRAFALSLFRGGIGIVVVTVLLAALWGVTGIWLAFPAVELLTVLPGLYLVRTPATAGTKPARSGRPTQRLTASIGEEFRADRAF